MAFSTFLFYEKSSILMVETWMESGLYLKERRIFASSDSESLC